jgi:hypothetical protein
MEKSQSRAQAPKAAEQGLSAEELAAQEAAELPDREAMSIISTEPGPFTIAQPPDGWIEPPPVDPGYPDQNYPEETI